VEQGKSSPDAFEQSAFNESKVNDRGLRTIKFSYPLGGNQRRLPPSGEDKLLVERLSQAMQIVIDHNRAYTQLSVNSAAQKWLKQFLDKVGWKELSENGQTYPPVRMFAIENGVLGGGSSGGTPYPKMRPFRCGFNQTKHNFIEARQIPEEFDGFSLGGTISELDKQDLITLLLPDLSSRLGDISVKQALTHEGYQLR
jgi:hypothetical protein